MSDEIIRVKGLTLLFFYVVVVGGGGNGTILTVALLYTLYYSCYIIIIYMQVLLRFIFGPPCRNGSFRVRVSWICIVIRIRYPLLNILP